ncbi:Uncharacterised protein [Dermacoccus nishinomiyaensis]|nr:Uncharacterised protein [Dermacoccus nishinomiyaensis]
MAVNPEDVLAGGESLSIEFKRQVNDSALR